MAEIITSIDLRGSTTKLFKVTDNINYVGLGWDINDVVGVLTITGPGGAFYTNTDFEDPDIVPATSRDSIKTITIPLDPVTGYTNPLKGNYTAKLTAKNLSTNAEYEVLLTYNYNLDPPTITADISSGPYTGTLRSEDTTNYGSYVYSLLREHRIQYPTQLDPPQADIVSTDAIVQVTPIYTNYWTIIITTNVEYRFADELIVLWNGTETFQECVYGGSIFDMADAINTMLDNYYIGLACQTPNQEAAQKRLVIVNNAWHLLNQAYQAGDEAECDRLCAIIQDQVQYAGAGTCGGPTSVLVVPAPPYGGGGAPATYTFENGLNEIAGTVRLGGSLMQTTTLNLLTYLFSLSASGAGLASSIAVKNDTGVQVSASSATTQGRVSVISNNVALEYNDLGTPANNRRYNVGSGGLVEAADYRSYYTARSLVSKEYVDANNNWGTQVVQTNGTLVGNGTIASPLAVAVPFPGFTTLLADYGYTEPTHAFSDLTSHPTTLAGYGITDAPDTFLELTDTPASYVGHSNKFVRVKATEDGLEFIASSGFVPATGGTFTGPVVIQTSYDWPLILRQTGTGGQIGIPEAGKNLLGFQDGDGDMTAEVGTDVSGNLYLSTLVSGAYVLVNDNLNVQGNVVASGTATFQGLANNESSSWVLGYDSVTGLVTYKSASSLALYTNATAMPEEVGGYEAGTTFSSQTMQQMWDGLLYPYQYPAFTSFSMSGQATVMECGDYIAAGSKTWIWGTSNGGNIVTNSVDIDDVTRSINLVTDTANDGSEALSITAVTKTTTGETNTWRVKATNSKSQEFSRNFVVTWYSPFYYGVGAPDLTVSQIQALTKDYSTGETNKTYAFSPSNQVQYIAYPASYGDLTSILDANGFETINDWEKRTEDFTNNPPNYRGTTLSYNIYEFKNLTSLAQSYQFKF